MNEAAAGCCDGRHNRSAAGRVLFPKSVTTITTGSPRSAVAARPATAAKDSGARSGEKGPLEPIVRSASERMLETYGLIEADWCGKAAKRQRQPCGVSP